MKTEPQIDLGFDPNSVKTELENEPWQEDWQNTDQEIRSLYLGTVFSLTPSGKYYMPFACSNVDLCEVCNGRGMIWGYTCGHCEGLGSREAYLDTLWWEDCDALWDTRGFLVESGEGDPCDVFATQYRDKVD